MTSNGVISAARCDVDVEGFEGRAMV